MTTTTTSEAGRLPVGAPIHLRELAAAVDQADANLAIPTEDTHAWDAALDDMIDACHTLLEAATAEARTAHDEAGPGDDAEGIVEYAAELDAYIADLEYRRGIA